MEKTEFEQMRDKALEQLMKGQSLTGKDGAFAPLLQQFLESALEGEMDGHLSEAERNSGNKRNGKGSKRLKTMSGELVLSTPEDRKSTFSPQIVKKRETVLADNLAPQIIGLYSKGMSFRDISDHIQQMYDVEISHATLSEITERVIPQVKDRTADAVAKQAPGKPLHDRMAASAVRWMLCITKSGTVAGLCRARFIMY